MTTPQICIVLIVVAAATLFVWGRWRHDIVAMMALMACVATGVLQPDRAFAGFSHPAVITVAAVLILSGALQSTGAVDGLARIVLPDNAGRFWTVARLTAMAALLSAFMNNVGALAILMPVGIAASARLSMSPGKVLMPLAFGSIMGGMTTLVGTPPNLIVSGYREQLAGAGFAMFDFTPVGGAVCVAGVLFVVLMARWLVPSRRPTEGTAFEVEAYLTEVRVAPGSKAVGLLLRDVETAMEKVSAQIVGLVRDERPIPAPSRFREIREGDILIVEADPVALRPAIVALGLTLVGNETSADEGADSADAETAGARQPRKAIQDEDVRLSEFVVRPDSGLIGRSVSDIRLRDRFGINLIAMSHPGERPQARLRTMRFQAGDVVLMQGGRETLRDFAHNFSCVPLADRALKIPHREKALLAGLIMFLSVAATASGLVPAAIAFAGGALAVTLFGVVRPADIYNLIDWPVIVLLAAMIPVASAFASTGTADLIARVMLDNLAQGDPVIALILLLVVTMTLSDFMNNAATAAVMCPIAIGLSGQLGVDADSYLMAVAIGASCAFLTPIGHQNNTLILGKSGFSFGDYWRLGLPLEILVVVVAVPLLLIVWPL